MKKFILTFITTVIIIVISIIYSNKNINSNDKIILSEVTHSVFYTPLYVAIENGYFKENNIDIELILTQGADKVAASILSKDADIGLSGPEATIYVYNNSREKLITFASLTKRDGQFIVGDCKLKNNFDLNDLKNKTVLAGRNGGMPLLMFKYALKESGIDESNINIDTSVEFANLSTAFISKQGDFVNLFEPNALKIEQNNYGCVLSSLGKLSGIIPYTTFYSTEEYIKNNKDLLKRFNTSLNKGIEYVKNNNEKDIASSIYNQFNDTSLSDLEKLVKRYKDADSWYDNTYINIKDFDKLQDILLYGKTISNKIDSSILITNEFN